MAAEQLQIQVQANVSNAISGLNDLNKSLTNTNNAAVKTGTTGMQTLTKSSNQATFALNNFGRVAQDAPFGIIGIANNINPLVESFISLRKETGSGKAALAALGSSLTGGGGLILGVSLITSALQFAQLGLSRWSSTTKKAKEEQDKLTSSFVEQFTQVLLLKSAYEKDKSLENRKDIIKQLNGVSDIYFGKLKAEKTTVEELNTAYKGYVDNLVSSFAVKQLEQDLEPLVKRLAFAQSTIKKIGPDVEKLRLLNVNIRNLTEQQRQALRSSGIFEYRAAQKESAEVWKEINEKIETARILFSKSVKETKKGQTVQDKINELLSDYKNTLQSIRYEEQIKGIDLSNKKLETNISFLLRAADLVGITGAAYKEINKDTKAFGDAAANQKIVEVIKDYKATIDELNLKEATLGQEQLNSRISATADALIKLKQLGLKDTNQEIINLINKLKELKTEAGLREFRKKAEDINKIWERIGVQIAKLDFNKTKKPLEVLKSKIDTIGNGITELKAKGLTEKDLGIGILTIQFEQLGIQLEKLKKIQELKDILEEGVTSAFTTLFEAVVKGENIFDALAQSVKRLVIELGNAIIKSLVLKAIQNAFAPQTSLIPGGIGTAGFMPGVRFDQLRFAFFR